MADEGLSVRKYEVRARFVAGAVEWTFALQTDDGGKHEIHIQDGEEIPLLLEICKRDWTVFYDPKSHTFRSGWNTPGNVVKH
jgi:hypothetical protein